MPPHDKHDKESKKVVDIAKGLAAAAMSAKIWEVKTPDEVADYCLAVAVKIEAYEPTP